MNDDTTPEPLDLSPAGLAKLLRVGRPLGPSTVFVPRPARFTPGTFAEPDERARIEDEFAQVVGALWDRARGDLGKPNGYADLQRLRDALDARAEPYTRRKLEHDLRREHAGAAQLELDRVKGEHFDGMPVDTRGQYLYLTTGKACTLRALFVCDLTRRWELLPDELGKRGWGDGFRKITPDRDHVPAEGLTFTPPFPAHKFTSHPVWGEGKGGPNEAHGLDPAALWASFDSYELHAEDAFGEAQERIGNALKYATQDRAEIEDVLGLIGLRRAIVASVLHEHELFGYVPAWGELSGDARQALTQSDLDGRDEALAARYREVRPGYPSDIAARRSVCDWYETEHGVRYEETTVRRALGEK